MATKDASISATAATPRQMTAANVALAFICVCLVIYVMAVAAPIMIPFVIALFVWYLINALARGIGRLKPGGRDIPRFLCFLLAMLVLASGVFFIYKLISTNAAHVMAAAPVYQKRFDTFLPTLLEKIPAEIRPKTSDILGFLNIGGIITALVKTFTGIAGKTLVVLFYTGFLLYEQQFFARKIAAIAQSRRAERRVEKILHNIDVKIQRYIWVKTFVSAMTGIFTWGLLHLFKVDFSEFWGVMAFILNFIPYIGSLAAIILPSFITLVQYGDIPTLLMVAGGLGAIQISWGSIIDPRMMGESLNISPIFIILFLGAWGMIWGVPGMFLSIPILAMLVITLSQFPSTRPIAVLFSKTGEVDADNDPSTPL